MSMIFYYIIGLVLLVVLSLILVIPVKQIFKLIGNGIMGGLTLLLFNFVGKLFGLGLAITPFNAIIAGFFGLPGVILLLILQKIL